MVSPLQLIFLIVSAVGLLTALGAVLARNLVHAALFLVAFFFTVACQFILLEAEFLAAMQVLIYIGAVSILLLFGIMLTRNIQGDETTGGHWIWKVPSGIVAVGVLGVLLFGIANERGRPGQESWSRIGSRPGGVNPPIGGPRSLAIAFSPTGQFVASADADGRVRLLNPRGGQVAAFHLDGLEPTAVAFSPEGSLLAAADDQGNVRAWNVLTRRAVLERSGARPGPVTSLAIGPRRFEQDQDNRLVVLGGADGILQIWDDAPEPVEIGAHDGPVASMVVTVEGLLVTAGLDGEVTIRDLLGGGPVRRIEAVEPGRTAVAVAVGSVPPDEPQNFADPESDPATRAPAPPPAAGGLSGPLVAFASVSRDGPGRWTFRILNAFDGQDLINVPDLPHVPGAVALASDGRRAAVVVSPGPDGEGPALARPVVRIWDLDPGLGLKGDEQIEIPPGPLGEAPLLAAGSRGSRFVLGRAGQSTAFYDDLDRSWAASQGPAVALPTVVADMPRAVGVELMTRFVIPFEVAGLMLTAALVGAIVLARHDPRESPTTAEPAAGRQPADVPDPPAVSRPER